MCSGRVNAFSGCIVPANHEHYYSGNGHNRQLILDLPEDAPALTGEHRELVALFDVPRFFALDSPLRHYLTFVESELARGLDNSATSFQQDRLAATLLGSLKARLGASGSAAQRRIDLNQIDRFIRRHLADELRVADLAQPKLDIIGAYPGIDAEERGQSEAIAYNLAVMSRLKTPIVATVIGEGGSGGALAIGVCDELQMLQYSTYSVISPEGCASILWKSAEKASEAAQAMGITASRLKELGFVDSLIEEPLGGAHRNPRKTAHQVKEALTDSLDRLRAMDTESLLERRYQRLMSYGAPAA